MKYLTDNFLFTTTITPKNIKQEIALKELKDHGQSCFIPIIQSQKIADMVSKLLGYHDASSSYEPEIILAKNAIPTPIESDTVIVALENETKDSLLWYKIKQ